MQRGRGSPTDAGVDSEEPAQGVPHEFDLLLVLVDRDFNAAVTSPDGLSGSYCNLCDHRWYSSCLAPYGAQQGKISQTPLKVMPSP